MGVDGAAPFGLVSRGNDKDTEKNHYYPVVQKPTQRPGLSASAPPAGLSVSLAGSIMKSKKPRTATSTCANQYRSARPTLGWLPKDVWESDSCIESPYGTFEDTTILGYMSRCHEGIWNAISQQTGLSWAGLSVRNTSSWYEVESLNPHHHHWHRTGIHHVYLAYFLSQRAGEWENVLGPNGKAHVSPQLQISHCPSPSQKRGWCTVSVHGLQEVVLCIKRPGR